MKKQILLIIFLIMIIIIGLIVVNLKGSQDVEVTEEPVVTETFEVVEPMPEVRVRSLTSDFTFEMSEDELNYMKEENLVQLGYLESVYRLIYQYDENSNQLVFVYQDQTFLMDFNSMTYKKNGEASQENDLFYRKADKIYVSIDKLASLFNVTFDLIDDPIFLMMLDFNTDGTNTYLIKELIDEKIAELPEKITMTWEAVYSSRTNVSKLYDMPGLDVISPVWYEVINGDGELTSKKQDDYIAWANEKGYRLWPAVTNSFDPDLTRDIISSIETRTLVIDKLVSLYEDNGFEGINIDFENIYKDDKELLSQFIAELTAAFHRKHMLVSIDVTFAGGSDNWSKCYDRRILGQWVDFVVIMSYDEHWGSSPVSGSVASINWLDKNLNLLIQEVDHNKVIMGIPFYMRIWFERPHKEIVNSMKVTSDAITMHKMESILAGGDYNVLWDDNAGQNYISFIDPVDNAVKKIWIEDAESLKLKLTMVHKYNLRGIAAWRRGYELQSIWTVLEEALENR